MVPDNLKAGVLQADWYDPEFNPRLEEFARHYGTVILPAKPVMPIGIYTSFGWQQRIRSIGWRPQFRFLVPGSPATTGDARFRHFQPEMGPP